MKHLPLVLTILSCLLFYALSQNPFDGAEDLDKRVAVLAGQLRCLVCQNETLADSRAELAADLRKQIREQMEGGKSDSEVLGFLTDRYGDFIRYRPPLQPRTYALWFGPFLLLACGLYTLLWSVKNKATRIPERLSARERKRVATL